MKPLVSVIVPVYNKSQYIDVCVKSIIHQSYKNIEIILIDDGSTDGSEIACDIYARQDERIKCIHQINAGVANARNTGLDIMNGEYFCFVDADDILDENFISMLMGKTNHPSELTICSYDEFTPEKSVTYICKDLYVKDSGCKNDFMKLILQPGTYKFFAGPWLKLFKKKVLDRDRIRFIDIPLGEDTEFIFHYLQFCKDIRMISFIGYHNRILEGTLSRRKMNNVWQMMLRVIERGQRTFHYQYNQYWQFLFIKNVKVALLREPHMLNDFYTLCSQIQQDGMRYSKIEMTDNKVDKILIMLFHLHFYFLLWLLIRWKNT